MSRVLIKFQRPLLTSGDKDILVYTEDRAIEGSFPPTDKLLNLFPKHVYKIFLWGERIQNQITFDYQAGLADDPGW